MYINIYENKYIWRCKDKNRTSTPPEGSRIVTSRPGTHCYHVDSGVFDVERWLWDGSARALGPCPSALVADWDLWSSFEGHVIPLL